LYFIKIIKSKIIWFIWTYLKSSHPIYTTPPLFSLHIHISLSLYLSTISHQTLRFSSFIFINFLFFFRSISQSTTFHFLHSTKIMKILCWNITRAYTDWKVSQLKKMYFETKHNDFSKTLFSKWWEEMLFKYE